MVWPTMRLMFWMPEEWTSFFYLWIMEWKEVRDDPLEPLSFRL
jgi:hypothetical protein